MGNRGKVISIDFSRRRLKERAEKYYDEGNYLSALHFAHSELSRYGGDGDTHTLLSDIYEKMGLYSSAINHWFRFMDECSPEDLPDIYEGLAVNYLNLGNETHSAFYYNKLLDVDDTLTAEYKAEIVDIFSSDQKSPFRFVYPPELSDYTKEARMGAEALKNGDLKNALQLLSMVAKGSKEYSAAREMQAVAYLLSGEADKAERVCLELIGDEPENVPALATLSAVYTEQGRVEESLEIAKKLYATTPKTLEEKYKIASVCCENELHAEALSLFLEIEKDIPYDGNMLYFKAVAAFKSGNEELAARTLETLCTIYPDAAVADYYLKAVRRYLDGAAERPDLTYFYRVPEQERELRCRDLALLAKLPREEAEALGAGFAIEGYFSWCFDEMDGMERDLQYLGVVVAEHARVDGFLRDVLLDCEVKDVLKIELLRLLYLRNEENVFGVVICNIYRSVTIPALRLGVKRRKKFLEAYAKTASKFTAINEVYIHRICSATQALYETFKRKDCWDLADNADDLSCAIYLLSGLKEVGKTAVAAAPVFDADFRRVDRIIAKALEKEEKEKTEI